MALPKYKPGQWLIHNATGHFLRIDFAITWHNSNFIRYSTTWIHGDDTFPLDSFQDEKNLDKYFQIAKAASVLYGV